MFTFNMEVHHRTGIQYTLVPLGKTKAYIATISVDGSLSAQNARENGTVARSLLRLYIILRSTLSTPRPIGRRVSVGSSLVLNWTIPMSAM